MSPELIKVINAETPKMNPLLANGLATIHMKYVENYVDQIMTLAIKDSVPGLTYQGYKICSPIDEFKERTKRQDNRSVYDISRNDLFMVKWILNYLGEDIFVYMYLPYCTDAGTMHIKGTPYTVSPVLTDRVISVGVASIFVGLIRGKVTFKRFAHQYMLDGRRDTAAIIYGMIYNKNEKQSRIKPTISANSILAHYLFCKYGVTESFKRFANCNVIVGGPEINPTTYSESEYVICSSTQFKPKTSEKGFYSPSKLHIAIRRNEFTEVARSFVGSLIYLADHFPQRIVPDDIDSKALWKILLGHILISGNYSEGILLSEMENHIQSLDEYIDGPINIKLKKIGINITDFYELMGVVIDKYSDWLTDSANKVNSMYDKELSILPHLLYEIRAAIFKLHFKLKAASKKAVPLSKKEIDNIIRTHLKTRLIMAVTSQHAEVSSLSYSGDNKAFKITSLLIPQSDLSTGVKRGHGVIDDPTKRLHVSVAEVGGYTHIPKRAPDGRRRLNRFVNFDVDGVISRDPAFVELLDGIQEMIKN